MKFIADLLSIEELGRRTRTSADACAARHDQAIWLLAQDQAVSAAAAVSGFVPRWLEQLAGRDNQFSPEALGDRRRRNGAPARLVTPELLDRLRRRLEAPPPDGKRADDHQDRGLDGAGSGPRLGLHLRAARGAQWAGASQGA